MTGLNDQATTGLTQDCKKKRNENKLKKGFWEIPERYTQELEGSFKDKTDECERERLMWGGKDKTEALVIKS